MLGLQQGAALAAVAAYDTALVAYDTALVAYDTAADMWREALRLAAHDAGYAVHVYELRAYCAVREFFVARAKVSRASYALQAARESRAYRGY